MADQENQPPKVIPKSEDYVDLHTDNFVGVFQVNETLRILCTRVQIERTNTDAAQRNVLAGQIITNPKEAYTLIKMLVAQLKEMGLGDGLPDLERIIRN